MAETRVGYWYATGPADEQYTPGDPDFNLHIVVSDKSQFVAHVTVENAAGQQFPVPCSLIDEIAAPPGQIYCHSEQMFAPAAQNSVKNSVRLSARSGVWTNSGEAPNNEHSEAGATLALHRRFCGRR